MYQSIIAVSFYYISSLFYHKLHIWCTLHDGIFYFLFDLFSFVRTILVRKLNARISKHLPKFYIIHIISRIKEKVNLAVVSRTQIM